MFYRIVLGIHAYGMGAALLMLLVRELLLIPARQGRIAPARAALRLGRSAGIVAGVGVLAGITLFFVGRWPLTPWLVASLMLIAVLMLVERRMLGSWEKLAHAAFHGIAASAEVRAVARDARALRGRLLFVGIFALIVVLMSVKPSISF